MISLSCEMGYLREEGRFSWFHGPAARPHFSAARTLSGFVEARTQANADYVQCGKVRIGQFSKILVQYDAWIAPKYK